MVRITKVHTGGGDRGETSLASGERVSKANLRVSFYGTIDELNSVIGMVLAEFNRLEDHHKDGGARATVRTVRSAAMSKLGLIQQELFDIGGVFLHARTGTRNDDRDLSGTSRSTLR